MTLKRLLGLDTRADRYAYARRSGCRATSPRRRCRTVGGDDLRLLLGGLRHVHRRQGRPRGVSVRGNPDHPVNRGMLCPKGLSEHHTIAADNRARYPLLSATARFGRVGWDDALDDDGGAVPRRCRRSTAPSAVGVISTGQLVTEEFYALGKLVQLGLGTPNYDGNTTLCMATAVSGYKRSFGSDGPPGAYEDLERADVDRAHRRQHRRQPPDPVLAPAMPIPTRR